VTETILRKRRKSLHHRHYQEALKRLAKAADFLYRKGAKEVYIFGSITDPDKFTEFSDIDLAISGIDDEKQFIIESELADILKDFEYDLLFLEEKNIRPEIIEKIKKEAILWKRS